MKLIRRPLIALITALLLVFAQQAALAHMIGHTGAAVQSVLQEDEQQHDTALGLSHICTTCIAFAALSGFAPSTGIAPLPIAEHQVLPPLLAVLQSGRFPPTPCARGPPSAYVV